MTTETILLVEENPAISELLSRALFRSGYQVMQARNGAAALTVPQDQPVDLVLLDRRLADVDGTETARRLRRGSLTHYLPILLLVPHGEGQQDENLDLHGADGFIAVPTEMDRIVEKVRNVLHDRKAHNRARQLLTERINKDIDVMVEDVIRTTFQDKAEEMLGELSTGLVDLLEAKARQEIQTRVNSFMDEEYRVRLTALVQDATRPVVEEIANEIVTRIASDILEDKTEEMTMRFEREELPGLAKASTEEFLHAQRGPLIADIKQEAKGVLVEDLRTNLPALVEKMVVRAFPGAADEHLPPILEKAVQQRVEEALAKKGPALVEQEIIRNFRETVQKKMVKRFTVSLGIAVAVLAGVTLLILKYAPALLQP